jgi:hypothetical protein
MLRFHLEMVHEVGSVALDLLVGGDRAEHDLSESLIRYTKLQ